MIKARMINYNNDDYMNIVKGEKPAAFEIEIKGTAPQMMLEAATLLSSIVETLEPADEMQRTLCLISIVEKARASLKTKDIKTVDLTELNKAIKKHQEGDT